MPKSKRDKKISLTQTRKKGLESKQKVVEELRECVDKYARIFTFSVQNMRNSKLKDVRLEWKHSRFHFGKNKLLSMALGREKSDEYKDGIHQLTQRLWGQTGLLFTNTTKDDAVEWFDKYSCTDFARAGNTATQTVVLEAGPVPEFSHSMEPQLRGLGLPTKLDRGVITLLREFEVCKHGQSLTPEQCRILKLFGHKMSSFRITIDSVWQNDGTFQLISTEEHKTTTDDLPQSIKIKPLKHTNMDDDDDISDIEQDIE